jgi:acylphosphatase
MTSRARVLVSGLVQGVAFRASCAAHARRLGLTGWVRNLQDGRVEAVFEGESAAVDRAVDWCRRGPPASSVEDLQVFPEPPTGEFERFRITY